MSYTFEWTKTAPTLANDVTWASISAQTGGQQSWGSGDDTNVFQLTGVKLGWVAAKVLAVRMNYYYSGDNLTAYAQFTVTDTGDTSTCTWSTVSFDGYASVGTVYCIITGISQSECPKIYITLRPQATTRTSKNTNGFELPEDLPGAVVSTINLCVYANQAWHEADGVCIYSDGAWHEFSGMAIYTSGWMQIQ